MTWPPSITFLTKILEHYSKAFCILHQRTLCIPGHPDILTGLLILLLFRKLTWLYPSEASPWKYAIHFFQSDHFKFWCQYDHLVLYCRICSPVPSFLPSIYLAVLNHLSVRRLKAIYYHVNPASGVGRRGTKCKSKGGTVD